MPYVPEHPVAHRPRPRVFLASRSPRRRQLLAQHAIEYVAEHPGIEDSDLERGQVTAAQWVAALAYLKARAGFEGFGGRVQPGDVVVGADTTCAIGERLFGTPRNAGEARAMIGAFSGTTHEVLSGIAVLDADAGGRRLLVDRATVRVEPLTQAQINDYVASGSWAGKAGAYNLEERLNAGWPIQVAGDPTTVVGLPMRTLLRELDRRACEAQTSS